MSARTDGPYDPGLQPERTLLAWRRTCLAFGVASLVGMRFTVDALGLFAVLGGTIGAGLAVLAYALAAGRYRHVHDSLHRSGHLSHDGTAPLLAAAAVLCLGVLCAGFLLVISFE